MKNNESAVDELLVDFHSSVRSTIGLTRRLEKGTLSPEQYSRMRARYVGAPNFVSAFLLPTLWSLRLPVLRRRRA